MEQVCTLVLEKRNADSEEQNKLLKIYLGKKEATNHFSHLVVDWIVYEQSQICLCGNSF